MGDTVKIVLISAVVSVGVTLAIMAYATRNPIPLIDTAQSVSLFSQPATPQVTPTQKAA